MIVDTGERKSNSRERSTQKLNTQGKLVQVDRNDVEARLETCAIEADGEMSDVRRCHAAEDAFLVTIHSKLGGDAVAATTRLHFHEAKHVALPRNQVEIAAKPACAPTTRYHGKAAAAEEEVGRLFASFSSNSRWRLGYGVKSSHPLDQ